MVNFVAHFYQLGLTDVYKNGKAVPGEKLSESVRITI